jgi:putative transposase
MVVVGQPHHITQRGNNRQSIFFHDDDRQAYLDRLFEYSVHYRLRLLAYCLMSNHVHLVALPETERSMAKTLGRLQADYARAANFERGMCGHLWAERYYSCAMETPHALCAMAYVEQNPVRAGLVAQAVAYRWSSAAIHCQGVDPGGRLDLDLWQDWYTPERWREVLAASVAEEGWRERFREATRRGLPLGSEGYVKKLESASGRCLGFRRPGRPRVCPPDGKTARSVAGTGPLHVVVG